MNYPIKGLFCESYKLLNEKGLTAVAPIYIKLTEIKAVSRYQEDVCVITWFKDSHYLVALSADDMLEEMNAALDRLNYPVAPFTV